MPIHKLIILGAALLLNLSLNAESSKDENPLHIEKCSSGIHYPTKGDESLDLKYKDHVYHLRIYHPKVVEGPHFSTPFFWASDAKEKKTYHTVVTLPSHIGGLSWYSINGYFFAEKNGKLRGFFLENGFDNADNGSTGLIFLHDGATPTAWRWIYDRDPNKEKGTYRVVSTDKSENPAPKELISKISAVMNLAEKEANAWPGP